MPGVLKIRPNGNDAWTVVFDFGGTEIYAEVQTRAEAQILFEHYKLDENELIQEAYYLGAKACRKGKMRVPANDAELMCARYMGGAVGTGKPYLEAWLKGWDETNLTGRSKNNAAAL